MSDKWEERIVIWIGSIILSVFLVYGFRYLNKSWAIHKQYEIRQTLHGSKDGETYYTYAIFFKNPKNHSIELVKADFKSESAAKDYLWKSL